MQETLAAITRFFQQERVQSATAVLLGVLMVPAFAPFHLWPLAVLSLAGAFLLWRGHSPRRALFLGWLYGVGMFGAGTYWTYISLHQYGEVPLPLALLLMAGLVAAMAAFPAVVAWAAARLAPEAGWRREAVILPALWGLLEWVRGWFLSGFPWLSVGYSQTDAPLAGLAPVAGIYALGALLALSAGLILLLARGGWLQRLIPGAALAVIWTAGVLLQPLEYSSPTGEPVETAMIQGNISQDRKWLPEERDRTIDLYRDYTREYWDQADVIVWPEAALPVLYHEVAHSVLRPLEEESIEKGTDLLMGILSFEEGRYYNNILQLGESRRVYRKHHLVPFGEFFPVPDFIREWMRLMNLPHSDFDRGARDQDLLEMAGHPIGASICYETVFASHIIRPLPEGRMLVTVSNDAWFGDSIAPHQHLQIARMRSIETRRPMIRATNNGISAFIDHHGQIIDTFPQFEEGVLVGSVQPREGATPYVRMGNWPVVILLSLVLLLGARPWRMHLSWPAFLKKH